MDPTLFPSLDDFLSEFGTLESAAQVDSLNERIRPYLLRRQKGDVEKSPLNSLKDFFGLSTLYILSAIPIFIGVTAVAVLFANSLR